MMLGIEGITADQRADLAEFVRLVTKWNRSINLVSQSSAEDIWARHVRDSARLGQIIRPVGTWVDLGSGAGFPGVVLSVMNRTAADLTLVEIDERKCEFLRAVRRTLALPYKIVRARIGELSPACADVVTARALAPLSVLLSYLERHRGPSGVGLFPKGRTWYAEVEEAKRDWVFDFEAVSLGPEDGTRVLKVGDVSRR